MTKPKVPDNTAPDISGINEAVYNVSAEIQSSQSVIQESIQRFNEATSIFASLAEQINSLNQNINNLSLNKQQEPSNITNNITTNINEPHVWDGALITELANKVADIIAPEISRAMGGDSNSY